MKKVCILDYGSGNVKSVYNLINYLGYEVIISNMEKNISKSSHIILPGVGSFGSAMKKVKSKLPLDFIEKEVFIKRKPFLGICVGLQILAQKGFENGEYNGLGWINGEVTKLNLKNSPLPHIGWNDVKIKKKSALFEGLNEINDFYFVHSYALSTDKKNILAETDYEINFCSAINVENIYGVQFHPEKSQRAGQKLMHNFLSIF